MDENEPVVGSWWRYRHARPRQYRFRYDGRASDGAYLFTRYGETGETESAIEVYNLAAMEPSNGR